MQFSIDASIIKKLILNVSGGLFKDKSSILSNYYVSIKKNQLSITSSNEVVQINAFSQIEGDIECEFLAKPDLFDRLKPLNGEIIFELDESLLTIKNGAYKTTAKVFPTDGYPLESIDDYKIVGTFDSNDILELLKAHIASGKDDEQAREFTGVLIDIQQNLINFVATNRTRLFWINKSIDDDINFYCIVEKEGLLQLSKILKINDKIVMLYKSDGENVTKVAFQTANAVVTSKVIKGKFPQYQAVVLDDAQNVQCIVFDKEQLKSALQKVLVLSNDELAVVEFNIQEHRVLLNSSNKEGEIASDIIDFLPCEGKQTNPIALKISGKYALDFINHVQSNQVYFYYKEEIKPIELKSISENKINYIYVMTPIR